PEYFIGTSSATHIADLETNETEMECVVIPLNFNVAEDIIQRNPWQEIEQDVREVQSDRE
ncbi:14283_t:CDS:2, partial [Rhizophagus irregularis]